MLRLAIITLGLMASFQDVLADSFCTLRRRDENSAIFYIPEHRSSIESTQNIQRDECFERAKKLIGTTFSRFKDNKGSCSSSRSPLKKPCITTAVALEYADSSTHIRAIVR